MNYFSALVNRVYEQCGGNAKLIINCLVGLLNKKTRVKERIEFTTSFNDAVRMYFQNVETNVYFETTPGLYQVSSIKEEPLHQYLIPIYWQVIDNANMSLHKLSIVAGGKLIRIKTDAVVVEGGNWVDCQPGRGNYRTEPVPHSLRNSKQIFLV